MNYCLMDEALIEKNVVQIEFYGNEEFSTLGRFCDQFEEATNSYQSLNTNLLLNNINNFRNDTNNILNKRIQYAKTINEALTIYRELKANTSEAFEKVDDNVDEVFAGVIDNV